MKIQASVLALALAGFVLVKQRGSDDAKKSATMKAAQPLQIMELAPNTPARSRQSILIQRQRTISLLHVGSSRFSASPDGETLRVNFELKPEGRSCRLGDLDMMEKVLGTNGKVMISLRDDQDKSVLERSISLAQLRNVLILPVTLERSRSLKVYRFSLCTDDGTESCHRASAADLKTVERSMIDSKVRPDQRHNLLWQSFTFTSFDQDLQILDATKSRSSQISDQLVKSFNGQTHQVGFLNRALQDQHALGSVPASIQSNRIVLPLYYNDSSACLVAEGKRP